MDDTHQVSARDLEPRVAGQEPVEHASPRAVTAVLGVVVLFLYFIKSILLPFVLPAILAFVGAPIVHWFEAKWRFPRWAAATIVFIAILLAAAGFGWLAVPTLINEGKDTLTHLQPIIKRAATMVLGGGQVSLMGQQSNADQIANHGMEMLRNAFSQTSVIERFALGIFSGAFGIFLSLTLLFYFLSGGPALRDGLFWLVPPKQRRLVESMWRELHPVLFRYFRGVAIVVVYATVAAYVGLGLVLHLQNAVVLAILTGLLEMVPVVGPAASAILAGLSALRGSTGMGEIAGYIGYAVFLRLSIDQLIGPIVLGRAGRVHPVLIIFCFLAGGLLFNIVGVIMAIPVALAIKTVLAVLYEEPLAGKDEKTSAERSGVSRFIDRARSLVTARAG